MNGQRDPDAILAAWLEEGPSRLPDATRRAVAVTTRTTRQTRRPVWAPWRTSPMNPFARMAVAAIAIAIAVGGAYYLLAPNAGVGGPPVTSPPPSLLAATPSAVPSAAPSASMPVSTLAAGGDVFPGRYRPQFDPPMTFTIDQEVKHHCAPDFQCRGTIDVNTPGWLNIEFGQPRIEILVWRIDKVVDPNDPTKQIDPPKDFAAWIAASPGITVVNPARTVKVGGLDATQIDVRSGAKDVTFGPIPAVDEPGFGMGANTTQRFIVVDVDGRLVVISPAGEDPFLTVTAELQPLIDSIAWD